MHPRLRPLGSRCAPWAKALWVKALWAAGVQCGLRQLWHAWQVAGALDKKERLLGELRSMNDEAERAGPDGHKAPPPSDTFRQAYADVVMQLKQVVWHYMHWSWSPTIEHLLVSFRSREDSCARGERARTVYGALRAANVCSAQWCVQQHGHKLDWMFTLIW